MLRRQFQTMVVAWIVVVAEPLLSYAVIVCGSLLQLLGHFHPSDEHRTITAPNVMLYSRRTHVRGHQEDRVSIRYCDTFGARRPPSSQALPSEHVFHDQRAQLRRCQWLLSAGKLQANAAPQRASAWNRHPLPQAKRTSLRRRGPRQVSVLGRCFPAQGLRHTGRCIGPKEPRASSPAPSQTHS